MRLAIPLLALVTLAACQNAPADSAPAETPAAEEAAFEGTAYGEPLTLTEVTPVSAILDDPEAYVGQRVLVKGMVTEVCEMKGCWMDIASDREFEKIQIKVASGLSEDDVDRMIKDAEEHAMEDEQKKRVARVRNEAEILIYSTEKTLEEHLDMIPEDDRVNIEGSLHDLKDLVKDEDADTEDIRRSAENLSTAVYKIAELMYHHATTDDDVLGG